MSFFLLCACSLSRRSTSSSNYAHYIGTNIAELFLSFFLTEVVGNPDKQHIGFTAFFGW